MLNRGDHAHSHKPIPIGEGLHPDGTGGVTFFVDATLVALLEEVGPEWKYEDARFIKEAVADPDAIFKGLKRPRHEECFAYSVRPSYDPFDEGSERSFEPRYGQTFLAFAKLGLGGYVVFDWE